MMKLKFKLGKLFYDIFKNYKTLAASCFKLFEFISTVLWLNTLFKHKFIIRFTKIFRAILKWFSISTLFTIFFNAVSHIFGYGIDWKILVFFLNAAYLLITEDIFTELVDSILEWTQRFLNKVDPDQYPLPKPKPPVYEIPEPWLTPASPNELPVNKELYTPTKEPYLDETTKNILLFLSGVIVSALLIYILSSDSSPDAGGSGNPLSKTKDAIVNAGVSAKEAAAAGGAWIWSHLKFGNTTTIADSDLGGDSSTSTVTTDFYVSEDFLNTKVRLFYMDKYPTMGEPDFDKLDAFHKLNYNNSEYYRLYVETCLSDENYDIKEHKPLMSFKGREVPEKLMSGKLTGLYINMYNKKNYGANINNANYEDVFNWVIEQLSYQDGSRADINRVNNFSDFMQKSLDHYDYHSTPKPLSVELPDTSGEDTPKSPTVQLPDNTDKPGFLAGGPVVKPFGIPSGYIEDSTVVKPLGIPFTPGHIEDLTDNTSHSVHFDDKPSFNFEDKPNSPQENQLNPQHIGLTVEQICDKIEHPKPWAIICGKLPLFEADLVNLEYLARYWTDKAKSGGISDFLANYVRVNSEELKDLNFHGNATDSIREYILTHPNDQQIYDHLIKDPLFFNQWKKENFPQ